MQNISFKGTINFNTNSLSPKDSKKVRENFEKATKDSPNHNLDIVQLGVNSDAAEFTLKYGQDIAGVQSNFHFNFGELVTKPEKILDIYNYLKSQLDLQRELKSKVENYLYLSPEDSEKVTENFENIVQSGVNGDAAEFALKYGQDTAILNEIKRGEGHTCEFKQDIDFDKTKENTPLYKTISAFSNTDGGTVYLGVDDEGKIVGIELSKGKEEQIASGIAYNFHIYPTIERINYNGLDILKITVNKSDNPPVKYEGIAYKRVGKVNRKMTESEEKSLSLDKIGWDKICSQYTLSDVDEATYKLFISRAVRKNCLPADFEDLDMATAFERLGLLAAKQGNHLTNAAALLFCNDQQFMNASVRVMKFKGTNSAEFISDKTISGNLFQQAADAENVIKLNINMTPKIIAGNKWEREEIWEYPLVAIREALLNAIIHRAYYDTSSGLQIKIFDDMICFFNPGNLVDGVTLDSIKKPNRSKARNSQIMDIFRKAGLAEEAGTGIQRIIRACEQQGLPVPEFNEKFNGFNVIIKKTE
ncbi:MAG: putative DNA binding domain-containing protein [Heliobacteriaceae bacterium]|jgi:ATP-dependent DNA helicase RecG|nr:putative DNA binding domain-containing protein [Heliobacteriaceae bacterium]